MHLQPWSVLLAIGLLLCINTVRDPISRYRSDEMSCAAEHERAGHGCETCSKGIKNLLKSLRKGLAITLEEDSLEMEHEKKTKKRKDKDKKKAKSPSKSTSLDTPSVAPSMMSKKSQSTSSCDWKYEDDPQSLGQALWANAYAAGWMILMLLWDNIPIMLNLFLFVMLCLLLYVMAQRLHREHIARMPNSFYRFTPPRDAYSLKVQWEGRSPGWRGRTSDQQYARAVCRDLVAVLQRPQIAIREVEAVARDHAAFYRYEERNADFYVSVVGVVMRDVPCVRWRVCRGFFEDPSEVERRIPSSWRITEM